VTATVSLAELAALVERVGLPAALARVPPDAIPVELLDLRWAWFVADAYRLANGTVAPSDVARARRALDNAWEAA
jgi:energy-coupling factor transporter transmembrane protein EcfT